MSVVLDWQRDDPRGVLQRCVQALIEGRLVAFPTETGFALGASGLDAQAVALLPQVTSSGEEPPLRVAVRGAAEALDWVPAMSPLAHRLARRCWPGPVSFVHDTPSEGVASRLPDAVRRRVCPNGALSLCMPDHEALLHTLRLLPGPLILASARAEDGRNATTPEEVVRMNGEGVALVIDDPGCQYLPASTAVRLNASGWQIVREGAVPAALLEQLSPCRIVFVCTGNTCRSPLAEALCKKLLAETFVCHPDELPARGFVVQSAGLAAMLGGEAAPEAAEVARELGADLSGHRSQPLTVTLAAQADFLIGMTHSHVRTLASYVAGLGPEPRLLSYDGQDLPDPIGCDQSVYRECSQEILRYLTRLLPEFQSR